MVHCVQSPSATSPCGPCGPRAEIIASPRHPIRCTGAQPMTKPRPPRAKAHNRTLPVPATDPAAKLIKILIEAGAERAVRSPGAALFAQGHDSDRIYFIIGGKVESTVHSAQGKAGAIGLYG